MAKADHADADEQLPLVEKGQQAAAVTYQTHQMDYGTALSVGRGSLDLPRLPSIVVACPDVEPRRLVDF